MSVMNKGKMRKKNLYTELNYEKIIDCMNKQEITIDGEVTSINNIDQILDARANCIYETKTITSGPVREIEIYPLFIKKDIPNEFRVKTTKKIQKNLNNKNAAKYFRRKLNVNFSKGDLYLTLNYERKNRPDSYEEAKKHVKRYIDKLNYEYMKLQLHKEGKKLTGKIDKKRYKKIKYMYVIEISNNGKGKYHVHMVISSELSMDLVEKCWKYGRRNNIRKIEPDEKHLTDLANYLSKDPKGKKRWGCSKGLKEPKITTAKKVSKKRIYEMEKDHLKIIEIMEKLNPSYRVVDYKVIRNTWTNMPYISVFMTKRL